MRRWFEATLAKAPSPVQRPVRVLATTFRLYSQDDCGVYAAAIAYYALFSVVPVALIVLSIFGLVADRGEIVDFVFEQVPLEETPSVRHDVDEIVRRARDLTPASISFGLIALIWSGTGIFAAVRRGLNATAHRRSPQPYWHGKLIDIALIPTLGFLTLLSLGLTAAVKVAIERAGDLGPVEIDTGRAVQAAGLLLPAAASFLMFFLLYRFVPTTRPGSVEAVWGAAFATVLFEAAKNVVAALLSAASLSDSAALYAGFSSALAFLFWMFVNATILLLGSEFARALTGRDTNDAAAA